MTDNYAKIVGGNLERIFRERAGDLASVLPGIPVGEGVEFDAFGETCRMDPHGITLAGENQTGVLGIIISLYALHADPAALILEPFRSFKEFPDSTPYHGAFATHTEGILVPHVEKIKAHRQKILDKLHGQPAPASMGGDFSFVVHPLPKIALCYIFYEADEDFPASVTCLFSNNAAEFMPVDGLADTGEYTSKKISALISSL